VGDADQGAPHRLRFALACLSSPVVVAHACSSAAGRRVPVLHDDKIVLDRFCWGIIRRKARQMIGRAGIKEKTATTSCRS